MIEVTCTQCGQPMHLPQHVADLPADARLCNRCLRKMIKEIADGFGNL